MLIPSFYPYHIIFSNFQFERFILCYFVPGFSTFIPRGGGSQEKRSSQLAHISVWNGGFKIGRLCGCVCTQKGGQNERFTHNMGSLSQMYTQTVELCVEWYLFL